MEGIVSNILGGVLFSSNLYNSPMTSFMLTNVSIIANQNIHCVINFQTHTLARNHANLHYVK